MTQDPAGCYPELFRLGARTSGVGLLSHENVDIAICVIEIIHEFIDDDVLESQEQDKPKEEQDRLKTLATDAIMMIISQLIGESVKFVEPGLEEENNDPNASKGEGLKVNSEGADQSEGPKSDDGKADQLKIIREFVEVYLGALAWCNPKVEIKLTLKDHEGLDKPNNTIQFINKSDQRTKF
ncbi:hypothetical protein BY996DRAFT_6601824 [Phakopsora pachyrhizi]|nr:hypothetical protein BY996DRAFT_6601824 [Phakopsora pachyrhizi]